MLDTVSCCGIINEYSRNVLFLEYVGPLTIFIMQDSDVDIEVDSDFGHIPRESIWGGKPEETPDD